MQKAYERNGLCRSLSILGTVVLALIIGTGCRFQTMINRTEERRNDQSDESMTEPASAEENPLSFSQTSDAKTMDQIGLPESSMTRASAALEETVDEDGRPMIRISVSVPAKTTVIIDFPNPLLENYVKTNHEDTEKTLAVRVDETYFYSDQPLDCAQQEIKPKIMFQTADGQTYDVDCPSLLREFPSLQILLESPAEENGSIMADKNKTVIIRGSVNEETGVQMTINGIATAIGSNGAFIYQYSLSGDAPETVTMVATKVNCVTATRELRIIPYSETP